MKAQRILYTGAFLAVMTLVGLTMAPTVLAADSADHAVSAEQSVKDARAGIAAEKLAWTVARCVVSLLVFVAAIYSFQFVTRVQFGKHILQEGNLPAAVVMAGFMIAAGMIIGLVIGLSVL